MAAATKPPCQPAGARASAAGVVEVMQDRGDPAVGVLAWGGQLELGQDAADVLVHGSVCDHEPFGDSGVAETLGHPRRPWQSDAAGVGYLLEERLGWSQSFSKLGRVRSRGEAIDFDVVTLRWSPSCSPAPARTARLDRLTAREREVLALMPSSVLAAHRFTRPTGPGQRNVTAIRRSEFELSSCRAAHPGDRSR